MERSPKHKMNSSSIKMGDECDCAFSEHFFTGKLSKLNSSQQSIETLSRWCITYRKRAKRVVEMWHMAFKSAPQERQVSLLYLVNEILQTSRRKGDEFLNEFWKVLPTVLNDVYDSGEENCRKVASRLINLWAERKVFESKGQNLLDELLGKKASPRKKPSPINVGKNPYHIKVLKRDAKCLRINLSVGGLPEKILVALDKIANEEVALDECRSAVSYLRDLENNGNLLGSDAVSNKQKQEDVLQQSISQLEKIESTRVALISQLREALQDQESKLEVIQSELLTARSQIEQTVNMKLRLTSVMPTANQITADPGFSPVQGTYSPIPAPPTHSLTSFANPRISDEENKRVTAAAVAAKLTASTSSAQMLSPLVAEEAALMSKRPKLDEPVILNYGMPPFATSGPPPQQSQPQPQVLPAHGGGYNGLVGMGFEKTMIV